MGLFQKQADEIYYVHIGNEIIEVTGEHPFWLDGKGWTFVKELKVGDLLVSSDGTKLAIDKIEKEPREATVYNFEVEDFNSYFVSNLGIWVHNCDINPSPNQLLGIKKGGGNPRSALNDIVKAKDGASSKSRDLTKDEKKIANQILNDIVDAKNGNTAALASLQARGDHALENRASSGNYAGWNSVYVGTTGGASNTVRVLYKQTSNGIQWNVAIWH
ncbi:polymorphic toxin-type HINT domain-containing protein [Paenibacillus sinopodophylli]|uniref:polymorphic toxin-type HINT domain-containing protein n=1 Tax=Paenibacillus sinopodophylli TaxID=1837342 RepID=UPI001FEB44F5